MFDRKREYMSKYSELKTIYDRLQDEKSKNIFTNRLQMYITQDKRYLFAENNDKITGLIFSHKPDIPIIIYGTGGIADNVFNSLDQFISVACFCDEQYDKDSFHNGLPVISIDELTSNYKNSVVLILSDNHQMAIIRNLMRHGFKRDQIITLALPGIEYFDLPCFVPSENEIFVDAGGYDGDTVRKFLTWCNRRYKKIYVFEPDIENCKKLRATIINEKINNVEIYEQGVWNKKERLYFDNNGDNISHITADGKTQIIVDTIDNMVGDEAVTFIKLDVEGAELEALEGAKETIERNRPRIAVCIYHKPEDFIKIPLYIINNFPYYKLYIRKYSHAWNYYDTILYAVT